MYVLIAAQMCNGRFEQSFLNKQYEIAVVIFGSTFHRGIHRLSFVHSFLDICCGTGALGLCLAQVWQLYSNGINL